MATHVSDYKQESKRIVLDLIAHDNNVSVSDLLIEHFDWSNPTFHEGSTNDTEVTLTAKRGSGYSGSQTFNYKRVSITQVPGIDGKAPDEEAEVTKLSDVLAIVNAKFGINLRPEDVLVNGKDLSVADDAVTQEFDVIQDFSLTARQNSYVWQGDIAFTLTKIRQALNEVYTVTLLDGLYAPLGTPTGFLIQDENGTTRMTEDGYIRLFEDFSDDIVEDPPAT